MSIRLEHTVYGPELARALMDDEEELAYALDTMAEDGNPAKLGKRIAPSLPDAAIVITFLRALADAIEAAH